MPPPTSTPAGTGPGGTYYFLDREIEELGRAYVAGVLEGLGVIGGESRKPGAACGSGHVPSRRIGCAGSDVRGRDGHGVGH